MLCLSRSAIAFLWLLISPDTIATQSGLKYFLRVEQDLDTVSLVGAKRGFFDNKFDVHCSARACDDVASPRGGIIASRLVGTGP